MEKVIECKNITHYYGEKLIYENLSFDVEKGKVLGLLGKNGTGKTTIINILNGYQQPRSGECFLLGENMNHLTPATKAKIGLLLEGHVQHSYFTIEQIEKYYSAFFPNWKKEAFYELMEKLNVVPHQKINHMSCGQRSQVALGLLFARNCSSSMTSPWDSIPVIAASLSNTSKTSPQKATRPSSSRRISFKTWNS